MTVKKDILNTQKDNAILAISRFQIVINVILTDMLNAKVVLIHIN